MVNYFVVARVTWRNDRSFEEKLTSFRNVCTSTNGQKVSKIVKSASEFYEYGEAAKRSSAEYNARYQRNFSHCNSGSMLLIQSELTKTLQTVFYHRDRVSYFVFPLTFPQEILQFRETWPPPPPTFRPRDRITPVTLFLADLIF